MSSHFNKEQVELYRILFGKRVSDPPTDLYASEKSKLSLALMRKDQQSALPYVTSGYTFDALIQSISCGETLFRLLLRQYKQDGITPARNALLLIEAINQNDLAVFELILTFAELTDHVVDYGLRVGELPIFMAIEERSYIPGRTFDGGFNALEILIGRPLNYLEKIEAVVSECISLGQGVGSYASCPNPAAEMERFFKRCGASGELLTNLTLACARDKAVTTHVKAIQNKDPSVFDRTYSSQVAALMSEQGVNPNTAQIKACCESLQTVIRNHSCERFAAADAYFWMNRAVVKYGFKNRFRPLTLAVHHNNQKFVGDWVALQYPLKIKGDVNALIFAVKIANIEMLKRLLRCAPDVNVQDDTGATPLHYAVEQSIASGNLESVASLLDAGADPATVNSDGVSPEHLLFRCKDQATKDALQGLFARRRNPQRSVL